MKRSHELELIDLGPNHYTEEEYRDCLRQLGRIGRHLGGDKATLSAFTRLKEPPWSILDVGCGGGDFAIRLAQTYPHAQVKGIDIDPLAIAYAREQAPLPNLAFEKSRDMGEEWDVVTATLVCHHLADDELVAFIQQACRAAGRRVILNDLHRHWIATAAFGAVAPLFFRNRLIIHDGFLSVRRAFKRRELEHFVQAAGIPLAACRITWHLGFRWIVEIDTTQLSLAEGSLALLPPTVSPNSVPTQR
jgi:2-polyprenyl-3-methyl-5-hydroxy-6-metoxy-1,4-benzoquinol methylase